ncbi:S8 family serine peptidase [Gephyromycinifex aptenodytis]|uniref:S8 family serine peptidase n=1 Tax=Gephyromycinifex aptenodytis TaxID=2716227 RepID=UPI001D004907|nr:S8 family serine peptidase [Gephyromycinifex aptenodytis]
MQRRPSLARLGLTMAAASALVFPTAAAQAVTASPDVSTPVAISTPEGETMSYIVNVSKINYGHLRKAERGITAAGGTIVQRWPQIGVFVVHSTKADFLSKLRSSKNRAIASVGPTRTAPVKEGTPAGAKPGKNSQKGTQGFLGYDTGEATAAGPALDPREGEQWNNTLIKADKAHEITDGSRAITVAVVDSGIEPDHPDLQDNIDVRRSVNCSNAGRVDTSSTGWFATTSGHGTHVAGTIAAARNKIGIVGVAPGVKLASVKVVNDDGFIYPEYAVCGIMWTAQKRIPVANHSYYVDPFQFWCDDQADQAAAKEAVRRAFAFAHRRGVVSTAAAGNSAYDLANKTTDETSPNDTTPIKRELNNTCHDIPAELPNVVTVSAIDKESELASFSNYGNGVIDVAAPGRAILSTYPGQRWASLSGTSMAAPHVAGVVALLKSTHRDATANQITAMLREQATDHQCPAGDKKCTGTPAYNSYYGDGIIDALAAVQR